MRNVRRASAPPSGCRALLALVLGVLLALTGCAAAGSDELGSDDLGAAPEELPFVDPVESDEAEPGELVDTEPSATPPRSILPVPVEPLAGMAPETTLRIGLDHPNLLSVDPALAETPSEVIMADVLTDGLTRTVAGTSVVVGEIAESWGTRGDDRLWEFVLGQRTWSDGAPIKAEQVKASIERAIAAAPDAPFAESVAALTGWQDFVDGRSDEIVGIRAVNLATIHFSLDADADLPRLLADAHFGLVGSFGVQHRASHWEIVRPAADRLLLQHAEPKSVEFPHLELIAIASTEQMNDALSAGTLDIATLSSDQSPTLSWRPDLTWITTRGDGSFDVESVTRN